MRFPSYFHSLTYACNLGGVQLISSGFEDDDGEAVLLTLLKACLSSSLSLQVPTVGVASVFSPSHSALAVHVKVARESVRSKTSRRMVT